jgi:hypothetical protein
MSIMLHTNRLLDLEGTHIPLEALCDEIIATASSVTAEADAFLKLNPEAQVVKIEIKVSVVKTQQNDELLLNG